MAGKRLGNVKSNAFEHCTLSQTLLRVHLPLPAYLCRVMATAPHPSVRADWNEHMGISADGNTSALTACMIGRGALIKPWLFQVRLMEGC